MMTMNYPGSLRPERQYPFNGPVAEVTTCIRRRAAGWNVAGAAGSSLPDAIDSVKLKPTIAVEFWIISAVCSPGQVARGQGSIRHSAFGRAIGFVR